MGPVCGQSPPPSAAPTAACGTSSATVLEISAKSGRAGLESTRHVRSALYSRASPQSAPIFTLTVTPQTPLLSVPEAAAYLGVSKRTVYTLIETHRLPAIRVGGQLRF